MDTTKENKYFIKFYCDNCGAQLKKVPISKLFQGVVCKMCKTKNYG